MLDQTPAREPASGGRPDGDDADGPFPGWYPDPLEEAEERFWNGREWTGVTRGSDADEASDPTPTSTPTPEPSAGRAKPRIFGNDVDEMAKREPAQEAGAKSDLVRRAEASMAQPSSLLPDSALSPALGDLRDAADQPSATTDPPAAAIADLKARAKGQEATPTGRGGDSSGEGGGSPEAPTVDPGSLSGDSSSRSWLAVAAAALLALVVGAGIGWFVRGSGDTIVVEAVPVSTTVAEEAAADSDTDDGDAAPAGDGPDLDPALAEEVESLQGQLLEAESDVDLLQTQLDETTSALDNEQAHNDLLQTWFTAEVRGRAERAFNGEVERACNAEVAPTLENTTYTRTMELMGTHADLVAAAAECQAAG